MNEWIQLQHTVHCTLSYHTFDFNEHLIFSSSSSSLSHFILFSLWKLCGPYFSIRRRKKPPNTTNSNAQKVTKINWFFEEIFVFLFLQIQNTIKTIHRAHFYYRNNRRILDTGNFFTISAAWTSILIGQNISKISLLLLSIPFSLHCVFSFFG